MIFSYSFLEIVDCAVNVNNKLLYNHMKAECEHNCAVCLHVQTMFPFIIVTSNVLLGISIGRLTFKLVTHLAQPQLALVCVTGTINSVR